MSDWRQRAGTIVTPGKATVASAVATPGMHNETTGDTP
jgi:hypothetical protein